MVHLLKQTILKYCDSLILHKSTIENQIIVQLSSKDQEIHKREDKSDLHTMIYTCLYQFFIFWVTITITESLQHASLVN